MKQEGRMMTDDSDGQGETAEQFAERVPSELTYCDFNSRMAKNHLCKAVEQRDAAIQLRLVARLRETLSELPMGPIADLQVAQKIDRLESEIQAAGKGGAK